MQTRFVSVGALVCGSLLGACLLSSEGIPVDTTSSSSSSSSSSPPPNDECSSDSECQTKHAGDHDPDAGPSCVAWSCSYDHRCQSHEVTGTADCQCNVPADCSKYSYYEFQPKTCNAITCENHTCKKAVLPAGPVADTKGDCAKLSCTGTSEDATRAFDAADLPDDANPCTVDTCDAASQGVKHTNVANGTACGDGAICMTGKCLPCKPTNPTSCGGEGAGEPANDSQTTPASFAQFTPMCTFTSGTDVDWYTFYANDGAFTHDVFDFTLWSTAPKLEVCIYVKCVAGTPDGGCATKLPGPNGSLGCCWDGAPSTLHPSWDMDCTGTGEDSGTAYVSVKAPGGDSCEQYAIYGGY